MCQGLSVGEDVYSLCMGQYGWRRVRIRQIINHSAKVKQLIQSAIAAGDMLE